MDEQQVYFTRMMVQHQLFTDVFRRFFHLLFKNPENQVTSFVLKGFFKSSDELGMELINAALEAAQSRCDFSDSKLKSLIDKLSNTVVDYFDSKNAEEQILESDAIRHPEVVIPLISQLCGVIADGLSNEEVAKCDLSDFSRTYQLGDFSFNQIPAYMGIPQSPTKATADVPPQGALL